MSVPLSDTELAEIRERKAAATGGGRWILLAGRTVDEYRVKAIIGEDEVVVGVLDFGAGPAARDDKTFIVNAGRDVAVLLREVDRLRAESESRRQAAAANSASAAVLQKQIDEQAHELDQLRSRLAEIAELHEPMGGDCGYCADETGRAHRWPCPTAKLAAPTT